MQPGKWIVRCYCMSICASVAHCFVQHTGMLVVMAVQAEQLPIAAIGRVVVVVVVFVMNG